MTTSIFDSTKPTEPKAPAKAGGIFLLSSLLLLIGVPVMVGSFGEEPIGWIFLVLGLIGQTWVGYRLIVMLEWYIRQPRGLAAPQSVATPPSASVGGASAPLRATE